MSLPFVHLNLRRNPFGELTAEERTELAQVDLTAALRHLQLATQKRPPAVQFVGDKGFGKTTHLLALTQRFAESTYVYLPEGEATSVPDHGDPLFIDEAQRLSWRQRRQLFRSPRTLVLGTHVDFSVRLRRCGRDVLTLMADQHTSLRRVTDILNARIEAMRRHSGPIPRVTSSTVARLMRASGHDLRSLQRSLYDTFQSLGEIQDV